MVQFVIEAGTRFFNTKSEKSIKIGELIDTDEYLEIYPNSRPILSSYVTSNVKKIAKCDTLTFQRTKTKIIFSYKIFERYFKKNGRFSSGVNH